MRISASISRYRPARGFTIAELLVVVVVVAILASIVIVTYNGVQNNAHDAAVKSDLRGIADKIEAFRTANRERQYPAATQAELQDIIQVSKGSYLSNVAAGTMSYCRNDTDFTVYARSASKNVFRISSQKGLEEKVDWTGNLNNETSGQCASGGVKQSDSGFGSIWLLKGTANPDGAGWQPWIP